MRAQVEVLSAEECAQVHERSLKLLADTGVRVTSERARRLLGKSGAQVNESVQLVRLPRALIEELLRLAPGISSSAVAARIGIWT